MTFNFKKSLLALAIAGTAFSSAAADNTPDLKYFKRIATFPVYANLDENAGDKLEDETAAEIAAASRNGKVVYYSNSPKQRIGLIDISTAHNPQPAGYVQLDGEPTSVAVRGNYLLVAINTSSSYTTPAGKLSVYSIVNPKQPQWVADFDVGGQPDAIDVSPDGRYAAIVVENERDEDYNDGIIPQLPAGHLSVLSMRGKVSNWQLRKVDLTGYADIAGSDPEPEYVDINAMNMAAVSLQENNHIILVDLRTAKVIKDFNAGDVDLFNVDTKEDDVIKPVDTILDRKREPDALTWVSNWWIATANEGDYEDENGVAGGSRGFTIFNMMGKVQYESGSDFEHRIIRTGQYPEGRSENKGNEPEGVSFSVYEKNKFLFVGSERSNLVGVYSIPGGYKPEFHQLLPTTVGPEGILPLPKRKLLVVASEEDSADDGIRSTVAIYQYGYKRPAYPDIESDRKQLIPWGALSGLVGDTDDPRTLYGVQDSFYKESRFFSVNPYKYPARITETTVLQKDGETVDYDLEGIAQRVDGGFWLASEGKPGSTLNLLVQVDADGNVLQEVALPEAVAAKAKKHGFEGVAVTGEGTQETVYVAFQRAWEGDPENLARIGVYTPHDNSWAFYYYPLESVEEGWVGLSEITAISDTQFAIIERDNQQGEKAQIKRLYRIDIAGLVAKPEGEDFPVLSKTLAKDLLPSLKKTNGWVLDKVEGAAIGADGKVYVATDNDGVDDASGETRFIRFGKILKQK